MTLAIVCTTIGFGAGVLVLILNYFINRRSKNKLSGKKFLFAFGNLWPIVFFKILVCSGKYILIPNILNVVSTINFLL